MRAAIVVGLGFYYNYLGMFFNKRYKSYSPDSKDFKELKKVYHEQKVSYG